MRHSFRKEGQKVDMKKVFVLGSNFSWLVMLNKWFKNKGCYTKTFSDSKYLFTALEESLPNIIILDENLIKEDGKAIRNQIRNQYGRKISVLSVSNITDLEKAAANRIDKIGQTPVRLKQISHFVGLYLSRVKQLS